VISYAEKEVFSEEEIYLLLQAQVLVAKAPYQIGGEPIRCHELARAVGKFLKLPHQDGRFGFVDHTWLWTTAPEARLTPWVIPNVLDVYVPGSVPQVALVHTASGLPTRYMLTSVNDLVIREDVIRYLTEEAFK